MKIPKPKRRKKSLRQKQIKRMDDKFSILIRCKSDFTCQRCLTQYEPYETINGYKIPKQLTNSHFKSRRYFNTRWLVENCHALCLGCHRHFESDKELYKLWLSNCEGYTEEQILLLHAKSQEIFKGNLTVIELWIDEQLIWHLKNNAIFGYNCLDNIYEKLK